MGKLKLSSDLFLEVNELKRLIYFLKEDGYIKLMKSIVSSYGIVINEQLDSFKVRGVLNSNSEIIVEPGLAYDQDFNSVELYDQTNLTISTSTTTKWIVLSYSTTNQETGTVKITGDGVMTGTGTKFTEVLRGRTKFPTKVKFISSKNVDDYEVLQINSDTQAILSGTFSSEENIKYAVIGCFTPGFLPTEEDKLIYEYDYCKISVIEADERPSLNKGEFLLASVQVSGSSVSIVDYRNEHIFNGNSSTEQSRLSKNPLMSLLSVSKISSNFLEMGIERGYSVTDFNISEESDIPILRIVSGECNFLGNGDIPNNLFNGWVIINRKNMKKLPISQNVNKMLYLPTLGSDFLEITGNDLIIVPNFSLLELEITVNGKNYCFRESLENVKSYLSLPVSSGNNIITLHYRMSNESYSTSYGDFSISNYVNIDGETVSLIDSSFNVNI